MGGAMVVGALTSMAATASEHLFFEMAGPRNGAMPAFSVAADGPACNSTQRTILVSPQAYAGAASLVARVGSASPLADEPYFLVTTFKSARPESATFLADRAVGHLVRELVRMCEADGRRAPDLLVEIERSLP
jgi:hypothetical protein